MDLTVAVVVVAVATAIALWKPMFGNMENFAECIGYWFTPDAWSFLNNDYWEDCWAELKLGFWILSSGGVGYGGVGNIDIRDGAFIFERDQSIGTPGGTMTVENGATAIFYTSSATTSAMPD